MEPEQAAEYSDGAYNYPHYAKIALIEMNRQVGTLKTNRSVAVRGLMIRHLVLPHRISGSEEFLKFLAEEFPKDTYVNIMDQYRPCYRANDHRPLDRGITREEFSRAVKIAQDLGLERLDGLRSLGFL